MESPGGICTRAHFLEPRCLVLCSRCPVRYGSRCSVRGSRRREWVPQKRREPETRTRHPEPDVAPGTQHREPGTVRLLTVIRFYSGETSFSPTTPATIRTMQATLRALIDSSNSQMPRMAVPAAPRPVQTA